MSIARLLIVLSLAVIFALGLMMVFNTTAAEVLDRSLNRHTHHALFRQIVYAVIALVCALLVWRIGYEHLLKMAPLCFFLGLLLLILVLVPHVGQVRNGAKRWLGLGPFSFQPSEFMKYLILMFYIETLLLKNVAEVRFSQFLKVASICALAILCVMLEPDNGTAFVICCSLVPLFFLTRMRMRYWVVPLVLFIAFGGFCAYRLPYVRGRLAVYLNPSLDIRGRGHQPHQAKIALGSGQLLGRGAGASLQKLTYLPEAQNDYIAAIYAEEFGFVGALTLILLYMVFISAGISIAMRAPTEAGAYLACAITILIGLQAFLNLAVVSSLLPSKGVNLPFFSQGGSSLIANMVGVAILLNIPQVSQEADVKEAKYTH